MTTKRKRLMLSNGTKNNYNLQLKNIIENH